MLGKVVRVLNHCEFEAEVNDEVSVGDIVTCGDLIAIVASIHQEESEYVKYLGDVDRETISKFIPDVADERRVARCIVLCRKNLEEPKSAPKIGEELRIVSDEELRKVHYSNGEFRIPYLIPLLDRCRKDLSLVRSLLLRLMDVVPEERELLEIILAEIEYSRMREMQL